MAKQGGSLPRGRRRRDEVPEIPRPNDLSEVQHRAQASLRRLVEGAGGRFGSAVRIPVDHVSVLAELFDEWAWTHGDRTGDGIRFSGQPGLWHALDELYPLQDPNRWDPLRREVITSLEASHWTRRRPPRGSAFDIRL